MVTIISIVYIESVWSNRYKRYVMGMLMVNGEVMLVVKVDDKHKFQQVKKQHPQKGKLRQHRKEYIKDI
jgi:hypothetical protein